MEARLLLLLLLAPFSVFLLFVLLRNTSPVLSAPSGTCVFPAFSHHDKEALSWIENRYEYQYSSSRKEAIPIQWPKTGRIRHVAMTNATSAVEDELDQLLLWLHKGQEQNHARRKFFYMKTRQKIKHESESNVRGYKLNAVAMLDLEARDTLLEIPVRYTFSDEISKDDPSSLRGSPWELRLATKILRERAKAADSTWYQLIKILPNSLRLPLFFSESELKNTEDDSLISEVRALRLFAERSFSVLYQDERAGADFNNFVWALALVYAFACRTEYPQHKGKLDTKNSHLLIPFLGSATDPSSIGASIEVDGEKLKLVMGRKAVQGSLLHCNTETKTSGTSFLFHGFVPATIIPHDDIKVFKNLEDLVDWYYSTYGQHMRLSKDSLMKSIRSALRMLDDHLNQNTLVDPVASVAEREYSVGIDQYIGAHMICALYFLFHFDIGQHKTQGLVDYMTGQGLESMYNSFMIGNQSMIFGGIDVSVCRGRTPRAIDNDDMKIRMLVSMALKKRLCDILHSSATELEEDEVLLMASLSEGFSEECGSHLCETCQWQTEELSLNDYLGVQLRVKRKKILHEILLALPFINNVNECGCAESTKNLDILDVPHTDSSEEFLNWCRIQGAQISDKLAVVHFTEASNLTNSRSAVRGVQAVEDIEQGETICILPLKMGLFKKDSSRLGGADSWHLAAANLLHEKAIGNKSKWANYISVLPKEIQTPIYLAPNELKEVQWWPLLRELIQVRRAIKLSFSQLKGKELGDASFEEYRWAATMVHSRAFTLPVEDDDEYAPYVLMPFMDMINHHYGYQADWMSVPVSEGKLEIVAKKRVNGGQQLFASFGPRSNDNLFLYYGFVLENNPFDTAEIFASFQNAVHWFTALWQVKCDILSTLKEKEECKWKQNELKWVISQQAIEDYSAGVTEQRPEWWTLVNMWADYGYEYMQFQPSPSIYVGGIVDPTLLVALEAVSKSLVPETIDAFAECKGGSCDFINITESYLGDFFACIRDTPWVSSRWSLHSSRCSKLVSRAFSSIEDQLSYAKYMVKVGLSLRCVEILNSMPTTLEEDGLLLKASTDASMHIQLARQYRYIKKLFIKQFIDGVSENF